MLEGFQPRDHKVQLSCWIRMQAPLGASNLRRGRLEDICWHLSRTLYKLFLVMGLVPTYLPSLLPSWLSTGRVLASESLGNLYLESLIHLCRKHWIPIMSQVVCIALDIKKKKKWIIQHACPQNVYALVGNTIMQINNNSYHFLNIHSSQTLWSLRLSKVNELD